MSDIKAIAFYLPQFHPIPENDQWWGKGFTEWTNVTRSQPKFRGHYQPHLPADLGFYDLRLSETREAQAELAKHYGLHGFCYYHYWFNGRRVLERPFQEVLSTGKPNFPFCLCWANENWTRRWDGLDKEVLLAQNYSLEDDRNHIQSLAPAFRDDRYIRIEGKPLFLVYRVACLPNPKKTAEIWREEAHKIGIGNLYLCCVESFPSERPNPNDIGFDAAIEIAPDWRCLGPQLRRHRLTRPLARISEKARAIWDNGLYDYNHVAKTMLAKPKPPYTLFRGITPSWDNSARRKRDACILVNSNPTCYENWLTQLVSQVTASSDAPLIFINAWNEWAEGNHLEPCRKWGHAYLEATQRAPTKK